MGRAKLSMSLINSEKARLRTFQKRKKGLINKTHELSTLCGIQVCMIIYGPKIDDRQEAEAEIWPPKKPEEIEELIDVYRKQPMDERKRRTGGVPNFFDDRNRKVEEEIRKLRMKNNEAKYPTWDDSYNGLTEADLNDFSDMLENKIREARARIEFINCNCNPRLVADDSKMELIPRLEELAMAESNPNDQSHFMPGTGLFRRSGNMMQWEVVHEQKMKKSLEVDLIPMYQNQYPFDHQQNHQTIQFDGGSSCSNNSIFDRQFYYDPWVVGMINDNMVVANSVAARPPPVAAGYFGSNVQPFVGPYVRYPAMATSASSQVHASQMLDEYYQFTTHELHDIKNQS